LKGSVTGETKPLLFTEAKHSKDCMPARRRNKIENAASPKSDYCMYWSLHGGATREEWNLTFLSKFPLINHQTAQVLSFQSNSTQTLVLICLFITRLVTTATDWKFSTLIFLILTCNDSLLIVFALHKPFLLCLRKMPICKIQQLEEGDVACSNCMLCVGGWVGVSLFHVFSFCFAEAYGIC
jgi:hypothetical protein